MSYLNTHINHSWYTTVVIHGTEPQFVYNLSKIQINISPAGTAQIKIRKTPIVQAFEIRKLHQAGHLTNMWISPILASDSTFDLSDVRFIKEYNNPTAELYNVYSMDNFFIPQFTVLKFPHTIKEYMGFLIHDNFALFER